MISAKVQEKQQQMTFAPSDQQYQRHGLLQPAPIDPPDQNKQHSLSENW